MISIVPVPRIASGFREKECMDGQSFVLGGGVTGLAAGLASGLSVFEQAEHPGGICRSYYVRPGDDRRLPERPADGLAYRFENGGGHWLFGEEPLVLRFLEDLVPLRRYRRRAAVYFPESGRRVPYPIQHHLHAFDRTTLLSALEEMARPTAPARTMAEWLEGRFGPTLCRLFFAPFHELYTAGLWRRLAPQDVQKSPGDFALSLRGALAGTTTPAGYNVHFAYPEPGLDRLVLAMAERASLVTDSRVVRIDPVARFVEFADGTRRGYERLLSTLPLVRVLELADLAVEVPADPFTSVLVLNLGAMRGPACPEEHWLYLPSSRSGFHRVGFYSNVDRSFLPAGAGEERVSVYVERAWPGGVRPDAEERARYRRAVVAELRDWRFLGEVEAMAEDWIEIAYTWSWPGSRWRREALALLERHGIYQIGRYGRWRFQGILESIGEGLMAGAAFGRRA